MPFELKPVSLE
jgi:Domain of unknown function (DUF1772)